MKQVKSFFIPLIFLLVTPNDGLACGYPLSLKKIDSGEVVRIIPPGEIDVPDGYCAAASWPGPRRDIVCGEEMLSGYESLYSLGRSKFCTEEDFLWLETRFWRYTAIDRKTERDVLLGLLIVGLVGWWVERRLRRSK